GRSSFIFRLNVVRRASLTGEARRFYFGRNFLDGKERSPIERLYCGAPSHARASYGIHHKARERFRIGCFVATVRRDFRFDVETRLFARSSRDVKELLKCGNV